MNELRSKLTDVLLPVGVMTASAALYAATALGRLYGDGLIYAEWLARPGTADYEYHNTLYVRLGELLQPMLPSTLLVGGEDPLATAKSFSILAAAFGLAMCFACCRCLGNSRGWSLAATALLGVSPVLWFFGSAIEVHAQHFALVTLCAWITLAAPWRLPVLAMTVVTAAFVLPYLSHQSAPMLGPAWVVLVQCGRARNHAPFSLRTLLLVGIALGAALVLGRMIANSLRGIGFTLEFAELFGTVDYWRQPFRMRTIFEGFLSPYALLTPLLLLATFWRRIDPRLRGTSALLVWPLLGCVIWWGVPERGGYMLAPAFVIPLLIAGLWTSWPRRIAVPTAILAISLQGWLGHACVLGYDAEGYQLDDRVDRVRTVLGERGLLLSCQHIAPPVDFWLPEVKELNLVGTLANQTPADENLAAMPTALAWLLTIDRFVLERSYWQDRRFVGVLREKMIRVEAALREGWHVTESPDPSWPMWVMTRR